MSIFDLKPNTYGKRGKISQPKKSLAKMTHGMSHLPIYYIWCAIKRRCKNKSDSSYRNYGGRGIRVCDRWMEFEKFYLDMGDIPNGMTIERIDNNGNYEPGNCRWATRQEQVNNKRNNVLLSYCGITKNATQWARELNLTPSAIYHRIRRNWGIGRIMETPLLSETIKTTRGI